MESHRLLMRSRSLLHLPSELRFQLQFLQRRPFQSLSHRAPKSWQQQRSASSASTTQDPNKTIVLEKPDKFRPPSHPRRLVRGRPRTTGGYNQSSTPNERATQQNKRYPHTFPNEGTVMHRFLTSRGTHVFITMTILVTLAIISLTQTFTKTSPFAHLMPPITNLFWHPFKYISESWSVYKLHKEYEAKTNMAERERRMADAQKRRLYRRAHGMEDLERESDQGIDVRGIAPWDDGLTNVERRKGGRDERVTGRMVLEAGGVGMDQGELEEFARRKRLEGREGGEKQEEVGKVEGEQQQRKRKLWLGIW